MSNRYPLQFSATQTPKCHRRTVSLAERSRKADQQKKTSHFAIAGQASPTSSLISPVSKLLIGSLDSKVDHKVRAKLLFANGRRKQAIKTESEALEEPIKCAAKEVKRLKPAVLRASVEHFHSSCVQKAKKPRNCKDKTKSCTSFVLNDVERRRAPSPRRDIRLTPYEESFSAALKNSPARVWTDRVVQQRRYPLNKGNIEENENCENSNPGVFGIGYKKLQEKKHRSRDNRKTMGIIAWNNIEIPE